MTTLRPLGLAAFAAALSLGATSSCDGDVVTDPYFGLWCGDALCTWELEEGAIERAPTWHASDTGVRLVGARVALSQPTSADPSDSGCLRFELTADSEPGVALSVEMDFDDDGSVDAAYPLVSDDFAEVHTSVTAPERYEGLRVRIVKAGEARAVLGQVRLRMVDRDQCAEEPLVLTERADGLECEADAECANGRCADVPLVSSFGDPATVATCGGCDRDADCGGREICGVDWDPDRWFGHRTCMAPPERPWGEACAQGAECASGVCASSQCSECASDDDCGGDPCLPHSATGTGASVEIQPHVCAPGSEARETGAACFADSDCASGACDGDPLSICDPDGRPCASDDDCPFVELGGTCAPLGVADGRCR